MKAKKTKLPENLYHYTDPIKYRMILATGKLILTPSNLKYDNATLHDEPLFFNEQVACSNQVSSSKEKSPKSGFVPSFLGIFLFIAVLRFLEKNALITLILPQLP